MVPSQLNSRLGFINLGLTLYLLELYTETNCFALVSGPIFTQGTGGCTRMTRDDFQLKCSLVSEMQRAQQRRRVPTGCQMCSYNIALPDIYIYTVSVV